MMEELKISSSNEMSGKSDENENSLSRLSLNNKSNDISSDRNSYDTAPSDFDIYANLSILNQDDTSYDRRDALNEYFCDVADISYLSKSRSMDEDSLDVNDYNEDDTTENDSGCDLRKNISADNSLQYFEMVEEECIKSESEKGQESELESIDCGGGKYYDELAAILELQEKYAAKKELEAEENTASTEKIADDDISSKNTGSTEQLPACVKPKKMPLQEKKDTKKTNVRVCVKAKVTPSRSKAFRQIDSPVAKYIRESPTPSLFRNFRAKDYDLTGVKVTPNKQISKPKRAKDKENKLPKSHIKASKSLQDLDVKPILPVANYKIKSNLDELTQSNTKRNCHIKQYFPSPTIVRHSGSSKVIKWAKHLEIKDANESNVTSANDKSISENADSTVLNVTPTSRTNTLHSKVRVIRR